MEEQKNEKKNYRVIFWQLFGIGIVLNLISTYTEGAIYLIAILATIIWLIFWCKNFNQAWKVIGKKYGWAVGLIALIPFGALAGIAIAHHYLKSSDYWRGEYKSFKLQK